LDDNCLEAICTYLVQSLQTLDLTGCDYILGTKPPVSKFKNLQILLLSGCDRLSGATILALTKLSDNNLIQLEFPKPKHSEDENFIEHLSPYLSDKLRKLTVENDPTSTITGISHCTNLENLGNFFDAIYYDDWGTLPDSCLKILSTFSQLKSLKWSVAEDQKNLDSVFCKLVNLKEFENFSSQLNLDVLKCLPLYCPQLEVLKLTKLGGTQNSSKIPESDFIRLVRGLPNLKVLKVR
jgi:hypothetical protein